MSAARRRSRRRKAKRPEVEYAELVLRGKVPACHWVQLACRRHLDDLEESEADPSSRWVFLPERADVALQFCNLIHHSKGAAWAGQIFVPELWQRFILGCVFGWVERATGFRRFRVAYIEVPKKNGKTFMAAVVALVLVTCDGEARAEVFCLAAASDQARRGLFEDVREMVLSSRELSAELEVLAKNVNSLATGSKVELVGTNPASIDGPSVHGAIIDELHHHKKRGAFDVMRKGGAARDQPLVFPITTAGADRTTVCWEQHERSLRVLENPARGERHFAYIATIDEGDEEQIFEDKRLWYKANPNLGVSFQEDFLEEQLEDAAESPAKLSSVLRLHFDVWTSGENRLLRVDRWRACEWDSEKFGEKDLVGRRCFVGVDLSSQLDTTAVCALFPPIKKDPLWRALWWFFVPEATIPSRSETDRVPYDQWDRDGWLTPTPGEMIDEDWVEEAIREEICPQYEVVELGFDPWHAAQLINRLELSGLVCTAIPQGFAKLSAPTAKLLGLLKAKGLALEPHPVARWQAGNAVGVHDGHGNLIPRKGKSVERIDGVAALINAFERSLDPEHHQRSVYYERGLLTVGGEPDS